MQPVLLDMLTDDEPQKKQEAQVRNPVSHSELRRRVLRDLQWLFNCVNSESNLIRRLSAGAALHPELRHRLAGGQAHVGHRMARHSARADRVHSPFRTAHFARGLQVRCISDTGSLELHNVLSIEIKGRLWCVPYPLEFLFRTDVDLENGHFDLKDIG